MGLLFGLLGGYGLGLALLAIVALGTAAFTWWPVRRAAHSSDERTRR
jgi:hypothetical protein